MWKCHLGDSNESCYYTILGKGIIYLEIDIKLVEDFILVGTGPYRRCTTNIFGLNKYSFKPCSGKVQTNPKNCYIYTYEGEYYERKDINNKN